MHEGDNAPSRYPVKREFNLAFKLLFALNRRMENNVSGIESRLAMLVKTAERTMPKNEGHIIVLFKRVGCDGAILDASTDSKNVVVLMTAMFMDQKFYGAYKLIGLILKGLLERYVRKIKRMLSIKKPALVSLR